MKKISLAIALVALVSSCSFNGFKKPAELVALERGSKFEMKKFFTGDVEGFAIIQDGEGKIIETQTFKINGKWDENKGVIQQNFSYGSGDKDSRTWLVTLEDNGTFTAIGHDIAAPAQGRQLGNAMQMTYDLLLPGQDKQKIRVSFDDKVYLVDDKSAIMISESKVGFSGNKRSIISLKKLGKD